MTEEPRDGSDGSGRRKRPVDPIALRLAQERLDEGSYRKPAPAKKKRRWKLRRRPPADQASRFVLLPALLAPLVLVGGWSLARSAQPDSYDSLRDTLSDLAAEGASHREVMTGALIALGLAHVLTALLLRIQKPWGRALHVVGGLATVLVAFLPLSSESDGLAHGMAAAVAFVALALWPALGARDDGPPVLQRRPMRAASVVLSLLVVWLGVALMTDTYAGLAERVAALAEAVWPLIVAWLVREWGGGGGSRQPDEPPQMPEPEDDPAPEDTFDPSDDPSRDAPTDAPSDAPPESEPSPARSR